MVCLWWGSPWWSCLRLLSTCSKGHSLSHPKDLALGLLAENHGVQVCVVSVYSVCVWNVEGCWIWPSNMSEGGSMGGWGRGRGWHSYSCAQSCWSAALAKNHLSVLHGLHLLSFSSHSETWSTCPAMTQSSWQDIMPSYLRTLLISFFVTIFPVNL